MEAESNVVMKRKGCIKPTRGEYWIVKRKGKGGVISISKRKPSDKERDVNRLREQHRRRIATKIYAGLLEHGNFRLPKHPDRNDILIALCEQAGYHVAQDGSLSPKNSNSFEEPRNNEQGSLNSNSFSFNCEIEMQQEVEKEELSLDLTISYKYM